MFILALCIFVNAFISIIFKYFEKYEVNVFHAIVVNYFVCVVTGSLMLGDFPIGMHTLSQPWLPYAIGLSCMFVTIFTMIGLSVQGFGVVITTVFQKMTLFAPTLVGMLLYNEGSSWLKILGLILALSSIFVVAFSDKNEQASSPHANWLYPIAVFLGGVVIDLGLFYVNVENIIPSGDISFVVTLFFGAGCLGLLGMLAQGLRKKAPFELKSIWAGIALGIPNFFSIYLLVLLLGKGMSASVAFPINNIGILLGSALLGFLFFREKIGWIKAGGLTLAVMAIAFIALG